MFWQPISLKDLTGQELLEAVKHERSFRFNSLRNATIFHHPTLGDFELQHNYQLERMMLNLRSTNDLQLPHHVSRREGQGTWMLFHGRPHYLVCSAHQNSTHSGDATGSSDTDVALVTSSSPEEQPSVS